MKTLGFYDNIAKFGQRAGVVTATKPTNIQIKRSLPFIICGLAALFYLYEFMVRVMPSAMTHELMRTYQVDAAGLGILSSLFYYGYTSMQIPAGLLFDRFGPRVLLSFTMLLCSFGTLLFGMTDNYWIASFARFIIGFGASFAFIGTLVLVTRWFDTKYFAMITGLVQFLGSIGAIVGGQPIAALIKHFAWQDTVYGAAIVGVVISILMWLIIRDHPHASPSNTQPHHDYKEDLRGFRVVYRNPQTWWIALYGFCTWAPITIFAALWGIPFLMRAYDTNAVTAASGMTVLWLGVALSSPFAGWWSNFIGRRVLPSFLCAAVGLISAIIIIYINDIPWPVMYFLLFMFGVASAGQVLSFGLVQDINPPTVAGSAIGFNNMAVILGGILCQPLVGFLLKFQWSGAMIRGMPIYTASNYRYALLIVPFLSFIGILVAWLALKETHCKPAYSLKRYLSGSSIQEATEEECL